VFYRDLAKHMPDDRIVVIDASGTVDDVHRRVYETYRARFAS
jgi:thymidylate kinase